MFDIRLIDTVPESQLGNGACNGVIVLGEEREHFASLIGFWSPSDYSSQWRKAILRLVERRVPSCLITSIYDPNEADVGSWWLLYPYGEQVVLQDSLLLFREIEPRFDTYDPYASIPPHRSVTDDGFEISEWSMPMAAFTDYLKR